MQAFPSSFDPVQLCERIRRSDREAERELIERFQPRVRTMLTVRTSDRDAAEEISQEVMMAALCALREGKAREPERLAAFVYGIARNLANDYVRRRTRERAEPLEAAGEVAAANDAEECERVAEARRGIERLEQLDREVLTLTLADGLEPSEIAGRLGISAEAVRQRKSRALKRLVAQLQPGVTRGGGEAT